MTILFFCISSDLLGQDFEKQFKTYKESHARNFNQFVEQNDKEFADFLRKDWKAFDVIKADEKLVKPKPQIVPACDGQEVIPIELDFAPSSRAIKLEEELVMPVNYKISDYKGEIVQTDIEYFGSPVSIRSPKGFFDFHGKSPSPDYFADFWDSVSEKDYRMILDDLFKYRADFSLNDFGYYLLVKQFAQKHLDQSNDELMTWFILTKSKYKTRIGYNDDRVFILLPSQLQIYGTSYMIDNGLSYYVMDYESGSEIYSYDKDYREAYQSYDFSIKQPINLTIEKSIRTVKFDKDSISIDIEFNQNAIDFYNEVPGIELSGYFNSTLSELTAQSLADELSPYLEGLSQFGKVSFLLSFVQNGFDYQLDDEQFGKERVFFPEEMLFYPGSDCEDRSVFFAYLVSALTDAEVIGLDYPEHVATAVHFNSEVPGDYYIFDEKKYVVCDPTYIGAPVGASIRNLTAQKAELIIPDKQGNQKELDLSFADTFLNSWFFSEGDKKYLVANYEGETTIDGQTFEGENKSVLITIHDGMKDPISIESDADIEVLDAKMIESSFLILYQKNDVNLIAQISPDGIIEWSQTIPDQERVFDSSTVQITLFDQQGKILAGKQYAETALFDVNRLQMKGDKILAILPSK